MKNVIEERLRRLREVMRREHLAAFVFTGTDPHGSEYVPSRWEGRKWVSGFDGSAGLAVVTTDAAALWTDSRYFIAAAEQLRGTEFVLMKERVEGTPDPAEWIASRLSGATSTEVGIDGMSSSAATVEALIADLRKAGGITVRTNLDVLEEIWDDRPALPEGAVCEHCMEYAGESRAEKLRRIRAALREVHADGMLMSALDDIAWTLNLRGSDVHCNPVFVSYLLIAHDRATLFVDRRKLSPRIEAALKADGVRTDDYANVARGLKKYPEYNILIDPDETNYTLYKAAAVHNVIRHTSPVPAMKAVKNAAEIEGFRRSMVRDGVALVRFLMWLKPAVERGGQTEMSVSERLRGLRADDPMYRDLSFDTIAGYQEHGAIVHYEADGESDAVLRPEGMILIDSGAQYADGTTDITRTVALGPVTNEQRRVYTLVLKGHLQLQNMKFPYGASGTQLDAAARMAMWREGMNYLHGTGHGVGSYLNVHEGPHQIRMEWRPAPLVPGMTVTDEPGLYLQDRFGVRTENMLIVKDYMETEFGRFLEFEPLTLCPIDKTPIIVSMLTDDERAWLDDYHRRVYERLSPHLLPDERQWLENACSPL